jgi:hypothetical protein
MGRETAHGPLAFHGIKKNLENPLRAVWRNF